MRRGILVAFKFATTVLNKTLYFRQGRICESLRAENVRGAD